MWANFPSNGIGTFLEKVHVIKEITKNNSRKMFYVCILLGNAENARRGYIALPTCLEVSQKPFFVFLFVHHLSLLSAEPQNSATPTCSLSILSSAIHYNMHLEQFQGPQEQVFVQNYCHCSSLQHRQLIHVIDIASSAPSLKAQHSLQVTFMEDVKLLRLSVASSKIISPPCCISAHSNVLQKGAEKSQVNEVEVSCTCAVYTERCATRISEATFREARALSGHFLSVLLVSKAIALEGHLLAPFAGCLSHRRKLETRNRATGRQS